MHIHLLAAGRQELGFVLLPEEPEGSGSVIVDPELPLGGALKGILCTLTAETPPGCWAAGTVSNFASGRA